CPRRSLLSRTCRRLLHTESGNGLKKISKGFGISPSTSREIVYKLRTLKDVALMSRSGCPSKFSPRTDRMMIKEVTESPKISSQVRQQTLATVGVKVQGCHGRCARSKLSTKILTSGIINLMATVKHGGGSVVVWGCCVSGSGQFTIIESSMNSKVQQENDPKHTSKSAKVWLKYKSLGMDKSDLNPIEML
uniref:Transposase Tc1-like domain-containing protein n=1 Tax=Oryzias melastigma TaxID=30732 RepID=A0A3B3D110_ORYME